MSNNDLLPCPFCGDAPTVLNAGQAKVQIACPRERGNEDGECWGNAFIDAATVEEATVLWNRRAAGDPFSDTTPPDAAPVGAPSDAGKFAFIKAHTAINNCWLPSDNWEEALDAGLRAAYAIDTPWPGLLRPCTDQEFVDGDYPTFAALGEDLVREVYDTKHDRFAQKRFAWYHEQMGKLLDRLKTDTRGRVVRIHEYVMQDLLEYSFSMPTGEYAGKRWKRRVHGEKHKWILGEYIDDGAGDGTLLILWTPIEVIPKEKPPALTNEQGQPNKA